MQATTADPDPTPTASPWEEYLAAAQSLDAVRRDAAAAAAAATLAASATRAELAQVTTQLELQRARLTGEAVRTGLPAPQLSATPTEQAAADAAIAGDPAAVPEALRRCQEFLGAADVELAAAPAPEERGWWPPPVWVWIAAALGAAAALACAIPLLLMLLR